MSTDKLNHWKDEQQLPLKISVLVNNTWQTQHELITTGPLATREMVLPIDISGVNQSDINVRLSTGFMFWEIDYAAIDFSKDVPMQINTLHPLKATDERGSDVLSLLIKEDAVYLQQPVPGNAAVIEYTYTAVANIYPSRKGIL